MLESQSNPLKTHINSPVSNKNSWKPKNGSWFWGPGPHDVIQICINILPLWHHRQKTQNPKSCLLKIIVTYWVENEHTKVSDVWSEQLWLFDEDDAHYWTDVSERFLTETSNAWIKPGKLVHFNTFFLNVVQCCNFQLAFIGYAQLFNTRQCAPISRFGVCIFIGMQ